MSKMRESSICMYVMFLLLMGNQTWATLYRMDDFTLLSPGTAIDGATANSDPAGPAMAAWDTQPEDTGLIQVWFDPSGAGNSSLSAEGYSESARACMLSRSSSSGWIEDSEATEGTKGTLFLRFYVDSAIPNVEAYFGIGTGTTSVSDTDRSRIRVGVVVYNDPVSGLGLYQMVGSARISGGVHSHLRRADLAPDTWYNLWIVADRTGMPTSVDLYDVYLNTGGAATTAQRVVDDALFSTATASSLKGFHAVLEASADAVYFDDLYMDNDAEDLTNPAVLWRGTTHPDPRDKAQLDTSNVTLRWQMGVDPANASQPNPMITKHYLYILPIHPDDVVNWDDYLVTIPAGSPPSAVASYGPLSLSPDKTYWWVVDESINDSEPSAPETILGRIWSFDTVKTIPAITSGPTHAFVLTNEQAVLTIDVNSMSETHYVWYKGVSGDTSTPVVGAADSNVLTVHNAQIGHEGTYWCRITNIGGSIDSSIGRLVIKRVLANWTMDETDYVDGQYRDISGNNHHADVVGQPIFTTDPNGKASAAIKVGLAGGYATAGKWDPSAVSESLGISVWIKPAVPGANSGIVSKRESWGDANMRWTLNYNTGDSVRFITESGGSLYSESAVPQNEWTHVACTYDVVADQAKMYLNGEDAGTDDGFALDSNSVATIRLGHYDSTVIENDIFTGDLDDIRIYNYGLSSDEVAELYYDVTGEPPCKTKLDPRFDLDNNCRINFADYAIFVSHWLECGLYPQSECSE